MLLGYQDAEAIHHKLSLVLAIQLFASAQKDKELESACETELLAIRVEIAVLQDQHLRQWLETVPKHLPRFVPDTIDNWNARANNFNQWAMLNWDERTALLQKHAVVFPAR